MPRRFLFLLKIQGIRPFSIITLLLAITLILLKRIKIGIKIGKKRKYLDIYFLLWNASYLDRCHNKCNKCPNTPDNRSILLWIPLKSNV